LIPEVHGLFSVGNMGLTGRIPAVFTLYGHSGAEPFSGGRRLIAAAFL
jgi:hypothetical protein